MSITYDAPPPNLTSLRMRIRNIVGGAEDLAQRRMRVIATTAAAQMLPSGVVKGGSAMNFRGGPQATRFSIDLDAARPFDVSVDDFIAAYEQELADGWAGFTGTLRAQKPLNPPGVPAEYVMRPYDVKLVYKGSALSTVRLELVHDEIRAVANPRHAMSPNIVMLFTGLGLPAPEPVAILASEYQFAQKLHACSTPNSQGLNDRAHDLVDLQLLEEIDPPDLRQLDEVGRRIFAYRGTTLWPPTVRTWPRWDDLYAAAAEGLGVRQLEEAVQWANAFVASAVEAGH